MKKRRAAPQSPLVVGLAGNPNVGKSTFFNAITGMHQHTGNWSGKTVSNARGRTVHKGQPIELVDIPGTYSLTPMSAEEEVARDFVTSGEARVMVVVCDGGCLERNLPLVLSVLEKTPRVVVAVNLMDEARRKGVEIDFPALREALGVPVLPTSARQGEGISEVLDAVVAMARREGDPVLFPRETGEGDSTAFARIAKELCQKAVKHTKDSHKRTQWDRRITGRLLGIPLLLLLLTAVFYLTLQGANYPSALLQRCFTAGEGVLNGWLSNAPWYIREALVEGMFRVTGWVISVMLPPMAIFFPLFTLLEDLGYLPRVAFTLDAAFARCHACGKQALTICMGCGCNAAGVVGCRIIDSKRERLIAILTNAITPCNGRLPAMATLLALFFGSKGGLLPAVLMGGVMGLSLGMSLLASRLLSATVLKGMPSAYTLELPPFRRPQVGRVLVRSMVDRTLHVLLRAVAVAAPCGLVLWILCRVPEEGNSLFLSLTTLLDPVGRFFGLDGVLLSAFMLGLPANEIVLPIAMMGYGTGSTLTATGATLGSVLLENGWTAGTAVCFILFSMLHWPCSTTLLTIKKETGSWGWTLLAALLPTLLGLSVCLMVRAVGMMFA